MLTAGAYPCGVLPAPRSVHRALALTISPQYNVMTMPRNHLVQIRLSEDERALLDRAAHRLGLGLGPWLRALGLEAAAKNVARPSPPRRRSPKR